MLKDFLNVSAIFSNIFGVGLVGGITLTIKFILKYLKKIKTENEALKESVKSLLHNELFKLCNYHLKKGYISTTDYNNLHHLYTSYLAMGGNGSLVDLMERVRLLLKGE